MFLAWFAWFVHLEKNLIYAKIGNDVDVFFIYELIAPFITYIRILLKSQTVLKFIGIKKKSHYIIYNLKCVYN